MRIIAYTYNADVHCVHCTQERFAETPHDWSVDNNNIPYEAQDSEGKNIHPVFSTDEGKLPYCGSCGGKLK